MDFSPLLWISALGVLLWFWFDSLRSREITLAFCREMCRRHDVQLLDQTVTLVQVRIGRNKNGRLRLLRRYHFDFYTPENQRKQGYMLMLGIAPAYFELPGYEKFIC